MMKALKWLLGGTVGLAILSGLVKGVVDYIAPKALPAAWSFANSTLAQGSEWVTSGHSLPGWSLILLFLLAGCTVVCAVLLAYAALHPTTNQTATTVTEDVIDGVLWRWMKPRPTEQGPVPFCPTSNCDARLVYQEGAYAAAGLELYCENCQRVVAQCATYYRDDYEAKIAREILRRDRVGRSQTTPQART